jgi:ABC-type multidrug transport system fused ATPase/permease subunit
MFSTFKKLYLLLSPEERRKAALVSLMLLILSIVEVAGVVSILPLIAVLSKPELIETNHYLSFLYNFFDFSSHKSFMIFLGMSFLAILITGLLVQALGVWGQLRYSLMRSYYWSLRLFEGYLQQPYEWYLGRHTAQLTTSVLGEVRQVVHGVLIPALQIIASFFTSVLLLVLLIVTDPLLAVIAGGTLGGLYILISLVLAKRVRNYGEKQKDSQRQRQRVAMETFGGIKDVKIAGIENVRTKIFSIPAYTWARTQIRAGMAVQIPHLLTQGLLFGGMLSILLYLIVFYGGLQEALPIIALFTFATYRLMPHVQKIYSSVSTMHQSEAVLNSFIKDFNSIKNNKRLKERSNKAIKALGLNSLIKFDRLTYSYPEETNYAVKDISMEIPVKSMIGLVGASGSGKTTLVDIFLGLLQPSSGHLLVDGREINEDLIYAWQRTIGYVPQNIFLLDDTVTANIAFGVPKKEIDLQRVEEAAKVANLHNFVIDKLVKGYNTNVGDKGIRLSGGQRQRIGIARALYHNPDVLVFDEATSALDNITEQAVMDAINSLGNAKTIILIAHRLSTVQKCDCIYVMNSGEIVSKGTYDELLATSEHFQILAAADSSIHG